MLIPDLKDDKDSVGRMEVECKHCKALKWSRETPSTCCSGGKVQLPRLPSPPPVLREMLFSTSREAKLCREHIRPLNNAVCFSSIRVQERRSGPGTSNFVPTVIFQGKVTQFAGALQAEDGETPRFT